jgi:hypothetical protein
MLKRISVLPSIVAAIVLMNGSASAGPVLYTIHFSALPDFGTGPLPTAGSFIYDADAPQFTSFVVTWGGVDFDFTTVANTTTHRSYLPCMGTSTGTAAIFALMSDACSPLPGSADTRRWAATDTALSAVTFEYSLSSGHFPPLRVYGPAITPALEQVVGTWSLSEDGPVAAVPDPGSTLLLFGMGLTGLTTFRKWRR